MPKRSGGMLFFSQAQANQAERRIQQNVQKLCQGVKSIFTLQRIVIALSSGDVIGIWIEIEKMKW